MSLSSNNSQDSPPIFIYPSDQQSFTDASTLASSHATTSTHGKSWADKVRGSSTFSSQSKSSEDSYRQKTLQQALETSQEEVAVLRDRLAKIESMHADDLASIEVKVQH